MSCPRHAEYNARATTALSAVAATMLALSGSARAASGDDTGLRAIPRSSRELVVVTAPRGSSTAGTITAEARSAPGARWQQVLGPWPAELGRRGLSAHRHEGDGTSPLGIFAIAPTLYGNAPQPRGLHERYRRLHCGDWWDEDPASARYNQFVVVPCAVVPDFAAASEALWTETTAYPYFAVIDFNTHPIRRGPAAPGSGIFLHSWVDAPTDGCVALHRPQLLSVLQWLAPSQRPVIAISVTHARSRTSSARSTEPRDTSASKAIIHQASERGPTMTANQWIPAAPVGSGGAG